MSSPSTEPRDVAQPEDVVRWHEERAESCGAASLDDGWDGYMAGKLAAEAAFHRGAAASLRQLMAENERLKRALERIVDGALSPALETGDEK